MGLMWNFTNIAPIWPHSFHLIVDIPTISHYIPWKNPWKNPWVFPGISHEIPTLQGPGPARGIGLLRLSTRSLGAAVVENGEWLGCGACAGFGFVANIRLNIAPIGDQPQDCSHYSWVEFFQCELPLLFVRPASSVLGKREVQLN